MNKTYYITTPIYYSSGELHLGHCYTTVLCDAVARFKRMDGFDVFYLTGTDEHGQKVEEIAKNKGVTPKEHVDALFEKIVALWKKLNISYDKIIRTTDEYHENGVQKIYEKLLEKDLVYKSVYQSMYCTPCESFWTPSQLTADGKCPDCGRPVHSEQEESYFFRLSAFADKLLELYEKNPDFISPKSRMNEMINNFIRPGLKDLCVSRTTFDWGVPLPFDQKHVAYVWIDALANYITALGYCSNDQSLFEKFWPADCHVVGKEITRFHSIIWPALLMALDLPMPKMVYGHGWLLFNDTKMGKSMGNGVSPAILFDRYGVDSVRYYLLREIPIGSDGNYTHEQFVNRINADLCNSLGNLVSRTLAMVEQYCGGTVPHSTTQMPQDASLKEIANGVLPVVRENIDGLNAPEALSEIFKLVFAANKYIDETMPWVLAKNPDDKEKLDNVLYNLCESIRIVSLLLAPFLPETAQKIYEKLGLGQLPQTFDNLVTFGGNKGGTKVVKGENLYQRLNVAKEMDYLCNL